MASILAEVQTRNLAEPSGLWGPTRKAASPKAGK